jgi:crossover junction endodeoxyribonuclease RuvC
MRIIAIDPGYERLGIAILEKTAGGKEQVLYSTCFITSKNLPHSERLRLVGEEICRVIDEFKPSALSVETLFFSKNQKTALLVAEARGVILYTAADKGLEIKEFRPSEIKIAVTGHGGSDKKQIMAMIGRMVKISKPIQYDDEFDAIAIGITYFAIVRALIPEA